MVGQRKLVLVEGPQHERGVLRGRLQTQAPEIDGSVLLNGKARPGDWVEARVTQALPYDLLLRLKESSPDPLETLLFKQRQYVPLTATRKCPLDWIAF